MAHTHTYAPIRTHTRIGPTYRPTHLKHTPAYPNRHNDNGLFCIFRPTFQAVLASLSITSPKVSATWCRYSLLRVVSPLPPPRYHRPVAPSTRKEAYNYKPRTGLPPGGDKYTSIFGKYYTHKLYTCTKEWGVYCSECIPLRATYLVN